MWSDILEALIKTFGPMAGLFVLLLALMAYLYRAQVKAKDDHIKAKDTEITGLRSDLSYERGRNETLSNETREFAERVGQDRAREMRTLGAMTEAMTKSVEQNREALADQREERRQYMGILENQRRDAEAERKELMDRFERGMERLTAAIEHRFPNA